MVVLHFLKLYKWYQVALSITYVEIVSVYLFRFYVLVINSVLGEFKSLTLSCIMLKNAQIYPKNLAGFRTVRFLNYVWTFFNIMDERVSLVKFRISIGFTETVISTIKERTKVILYDFHKCFLILEKKNFRYRFWNMSLKLFYPYQNLVNRPSSYVTYMAWFLSSLNINPFMHNIGKWRNTCEHCKSFKVCLTIFQELVLNFHLICFTYIIAVGFQLGLVGLINHFFNQKLV